MMKLMLKYQIKPLLADAKGGASFQLTGPGTDHKFSSLAEARGAQDKLNVSYTHGYAEGCGQGIDSDMRACIVESMNLLDEIAMAFEESGNGEHAVAIRKQAAKVREALRTRGAVDA